MVLTNFENAFSRNNDNNTVLQTTPMAIQQQQQQFHENFLLRQQKIDYFNNCTTEHITTPPVSSSPESEYMNSNINVPIDSKPVSFSNGYYGFVAANIQSQKIVDDEFKFNNATNTTLTVNNDNHPEINMMETYEKSFCPTKNGNSADKRKLDDNFGYYYPGEMKRCRIDEHDVEGNIGKKI